MKQPKMAPSSPRKVHRVLAEVKRVLEALLGSKAAIKWMVQLAGRKRMVYTAGRQRTVESSLSVFKRMVQVAGRVLQAAIEWMV
mmetsp:Transcript_55757/g.113982  ORF Transcript_55757/g.113982 Transcript_55757/m.113982 type:complete len:84 (+) Transcript_55757:209-460(+)